MTKFPRIQDLGEQGLLTRLQGFSPAEIVGDDGAVLDLTPGFSLVATTDLLVDGVHFSLGLAKPGLCTMAPEDVGWRATAANLSDLAAMGAMPLGVTVGLGLPPDLPVVWLEELYQGITACLNAYGGSLVGGDVCRSPVMTVAIAAFGQVDPNRVIRRGGACVGDVILVTGVHGAARAGLELLLNPEGNSEVAPELGPEAKTRLIRAHQHPRPRLDVLPLLWDRWPQLNSARTIAGMDSSDGLADALVQICRASQVGARIDRRQIPLPPEFHSWLSPQQALDWALYGGEDFELVLCLPRAIALSVITSLESGAAIVGEITADTTVYLMDSTGQEPDTVLTLAKGFQHF